MQIRMSIQGNVVERLTVEGLNRECHALKLDSEHWLDVKTGEVNEYRHGDTRADNRAALRRTFRNIRALINANCTDVRKVRWITLTYAENMTDTVRLYKDFERFWKRFKYRWGGCEYISVVEPQRRGAWHVHMLVIWPVVAPFVPNSELAECWGLGFVKVTALDDIDNIGAYLSAYLGDSVLPDDLSGGISKVCRDGTSKRIVKGARLSLYPAGMQICRHSRGVRKPENVWIESAEDLEWSESLLEGLEPVYVKDYTWTDDKGKEHVTHYEQFNLARSGSGLFDGGDGEGPCLKP